MRKIAIIGGSYLQLPAVLKAKEIGLEVHCFSWKEGAVCEEYADFFYPISIIEKEKILIICQQIKIDGIVTIASDVAIITVNYVAERMGLVSNSDVYTSVTTNKYRMRQYFQSHAIPSPQFCLVDKAYKIDINSLVFPLIVKPTDRSGSRGVEKVLDRGGLEEAVHRAIKESFIGEAIIEEYVYGKEVSVEAISYNGKHYILAITDKVTTGAPYFVELEHHQPSAISITVLDRVKEIVHKSLSSLHITHGASHTELKITEDGDIKIIEVGARMGGDFIGSDLVQLSTGYDFLRATILVALGFFEEPVISESNYAGVYFLSAETVRIKPIMESYSQYPEVVKVAITDSHLRKIECSGDRSGYLIYKSKQSRLIL